MADIASYIVARADNGQITGIHKQSEVTWKPADLQNVSMYIIEREVSEDLFNDIYNNHYEADGDPAGHIADNRYSDIGLKLLPDEVWMDG